MTSEASTSNIPSTSAPMATEAPLSNGATAASANPTPTEPVVETAKSASNNTGSESDNRPRILIPEPVSPDGLALLSPHFNLTILPTIPSPSELASLLPSYHALIIRSATQVTSELLRSSAPNLKVIARAGVGVDNIDVDAATALGIIVVNSPSGNIAAAAEHTIALLMAVARNVTEGSRALGEGGKGWKRGRGEGVGVEVGGKVLGIVGLGKVGLKVARMGVGLGMKVLAVDPYASPAIATAASVTLVPSLTTLLPQIDFLTIHTPLLATTLDLISTKELALLKPTTRILNVARGGVYNEAALLDALNNNTLAAAGLDVFTSEPPKPGSAAEALTRHPKVVATPHLGASTVEAQENVSLDVCKQVEIILKGGLPTSAVNAPLILPEEYRKLQPFVRLIEKMGGLWTQHYAQRGSAGGTGGGGKVFDLIYEGELASMSSTRPLFAALVKGLTSSISESGGRDVNIVNASLIAKEKGLVINESSRRGATGTYASLVTLRCTSGNGNRSTTAPGSEQVIEGYVSGNRIYVSKLDRFDTNFEPDGTLVIAHNYDKPGKIGGVGGILGRRGVNIRFMSVAALRGEEESRRGSIAGAGSTKDDDAANEALMILGVEGPGVVDAEVLQELGAYEGILSVSVVRL